MKLVRLIKLWLFLIAIQISMVNAATEFLSTQGNALSAINIYPSNASITKTVDTNGVIVSETYVVVQSNVGEFLQKTSVGFATWDGNISTLENNNFTVTDGQINFSIAIDNSFELPLTVFIGFKDNTSNLYYGYFQVTAQFMQISDEVWDNTAVRKVLHTFAFGGFPSDEQINTWAHQSPEQAIQEIITVDTVNTKLSPPTEEKLGSHYGTLAELSEFWSSDDPNNPIHPSERGDYKLDQRNSAARVWWEAANRRGLNPVRQKIGFWETNYHLSVNQDVGVNDFQVVRYFDDIMNGLSAMSGSVEAAYQNVIAGASLSAAVATQFNHRRNRYESGKFRGNEDFGREYHQIFFGILGNYDSTYHEEVTIKNTSLALTDMPVKMESGHLADTVTFGTDAHHIEPLEILNTTIEGETAKEKIEALSQIAIQHSESLANLPIIIIRGLGDEILDSAKIKVIQGSWAAIEPKELLPFLREYAISTLFHNASRVKYNDSIHRHLFVTNQMTLNNEESYRNLYGLKFFEGTSLKKYTPATTSQTTRKGAFSLYVEDVKAFSPMHDVFGGQTGMEASDDMEVFRAVYNRSTQGANQYNRTHLEENEQTVWAKNWGSIAPTENDGTYQVKTVAEWLWNRFIADGLKNFGDLERFHIYSLLVNGLDAGYQLDPNNAERVFTTAELSSDTSLQIAMNDWSIQTLALGGTDSEQRRAANYNVGQAINFIVATPFVFAQEGK